MVTAAPRNSNSVDIVCLSGRNYTDWFIELCTRSSVRSHSPFCNFIKLLLILNNPEYYWLFHLLLFFILFQVGARLISHAGSVTKLCKLPGSTIQILGAEKALFRALKTRSKTPKYGLMYHSSHISKAFAKDKGRISRFLANKCALASRIDNFAGKNFNNN